MKVHLQAESLRPVLDEHVRLAGGPRARTVGSVKALERSTVFATTGDAVMLRTRRDGLELHSTVPAIVEEPGTVWLPSQALARLTQRGGGRIRLDGAEGAVTIEQLGTRVVLDEVDPTWKPSIPPLPSQDGKGLRVPSRDLVRGLRAVSWSICEDPTRPNLQSVALETAQWSGRTMRLVSTDGRRMVVATVGELSGETTQGVMLRASAVPALLRWLAKRENVVIVTGSRGDAERYLTVADADAGSRPTAVVVELSAEKFTDWRKLHDESTEGWTSASCFREPLLAALVRMEPLLPAMQRHALVRLNGDVSLSAKGLSTRFETHVEAHVRGSEVRVGVSPPFLKDALAVLPGEVVELRVQSPMRPMRFSGREDGLHVEVFVMPMLLDGAAA